MATIEAPAVSEFYEEDHRMFREGFRKFIAAEILPHHDRWEQEGQVSRDLWLRAGEQGYLSMDVPEEYGGLGIKDFRFNAVIGEEMAYAGVSAPGFPVHTDIIVPYIITYGSEEQKKKYLPKAVSGECITAIAMSEPNTGSDLAGVKTFAEDRGDHYLLNGQKTFITNGLLNDLVVVVARTNMEEKHAGHTLLLVDRSMEGYESGRKLEKMGMKGQDTAELYFKDVRVPKENRLGEEGHGFYYLMQQLPQERLSIAVAAVAAAEASLGMTVDYCRERTAFGRPIGKFQNSRFKLAEMKTEVTIGRVFLNHCIALLNDGKLTTDVASMAKWWLTEMQKRTIDECLQLHGGYGFMMEYPIAKAYIDSRAQTIYGGTTEIMKEIIGRSMGF